MASSSVVSASVAPAELAGGDVDVSVLAPSTLVA
jgi:hypothetical protein